MEPSPFLTFAFHSWAIPSVTLGISMCDSSTSLSCLIEESFLFRAHLIVHQQLRPIQRVISYLLSSAWYFSTIIYIFLKSEIVHMYVNGAIPTYIEKVKIFSLRLNNRGACVVSSMWRILIIWYMLSWAINEFSFLNSLKFRYLILEYNV